MVLLVTAAEECTSTALSCRNMAASGILVRLEVASNPKGTFAATGQQCTEIYTGEEVEYRWQGGDLPARCDYIRLNLYD